MLAGAVYAYFKNYSKKCGYATRGAVRAVTGNCTCMHVCVRRIGKGRIVKGEERIQAAGRGTSKRVQGFARTIPSDLAAVEAVCQEARRLLVSEGQTDHAFTLDLLLREFLNNAVLHGNCQAANKRVRVAVRVGRTRIVVRIEDEGVGFDWRAMAKRAPADELATSGRGLGIGALYAQRLRFNRTGNQVVLWIGIAAPKESMKMAEYEITRDGRQARVKLQARLSAADVPQLQPLLKQEITGGARELVFDLAGTTVLDSTGIGLLIAAHNSLTPLQGTVHLINVPSDLLKLLQSMRLVERLHATAAGKEALHG